MKNQKGITLIALVVTVVVIIILAAVSISTLTGNNSTIKNAEDAKSESTIAEEKEILNFSYVSCTGEIGVSAKVTPDQLENKLKESKADTTVIANGDNLEVIFNDTKNKYIINQYGKIELVPEGDGNYLLDNHTYYNTLPEAIQAANDGSTIKAMSDISEEVTITIDKNVTLDTNGKTINYTGSSQITINTGKSIEINGNGSIIGETSGTFILNHGNLTTNNVTIESQASGGPLISTILVSFGTLTSNNCEIDSITCEGNNTAGQVTINGGKYTNLSSYPSSSPGTYVINDGNIDSLNFIKGGTAVINEGKIGEIALSNDSGNINMTIGDINKAVNTNNPEIGKIYIVAPDLAGITTIFNYYNGIVKDCSFAYIFDGEKNESIYGEINIRPGYKVQNNSNEITLVPQ